MKWRNIRDIVAACLLAASLLLACLSSFGSYPAHRSEVVARKMERTVNRRMARLDRFVEKALQLPQDEWLELKGLPDDMVIYRYVNDSLQSWCNRFPVMNDDVRAGMVFDAITNPRSPGRSPLAGIGKDVSFCNLGPKWYLARAVDSLNVHLVAGLEIVNANSDVARPYTVQPISYSEGNVISVGGEPKFKIAFESAGSSITVNSGMLFVALILIALSGFVFLFSKPTLERFWIAFIPILPLVSALQFWGREIGNDIPLFSPTVYADSGAFYSLGAQLNYLVAILLSVSFLYIVRRDVFRRLRTRKQRIMWTVFISLAIIGVVAYTVAALKSIVLNSNISLELYKLETFSIVSVAIIFSYMLLLTAVLMLLQMLSPLASRRPGTRILLSLAGSLLFVFMTASFGLKKEEASLEVWARRLAVSRDISLEMRLRSVEDRIAADPIIASLSVLENGSASIGSRLEESYLRRIMQDYDVSVSLRPEDMKVMDSAEPISPESNFAFIDNGNGFVRYVGVFYYRISNYGISRVLITVEQKTDWKYSGYASIIGPTLPGEVLIPSKYSFARYDEDRLLTFKGNYAYSVSMPSGWSQDFARVQRGYDRLARQDFPGRFQGEEQLRQVKKGLQHDEVRGFPGSEHLPEGVLRLLLRHVAVGLQQLPQGAHVQGHLRFLPRGAAGIGQSGADHGGHRLPPGLQGIGPEGAGIDDAAARPDIVPVDGLHRRRVCQIHLFREARGSDAPLHELRAHGPVQQTYSVHGLSFHTSVICPVAKNQIIRRSTFFPVMRSRAQA